ncbi:hypothetical protein Moror_10226 [Moniliophthora roreri MCA 2997]|uniref:Uncharacterized protein n=2 Tax=Moniliophthora roreri TaxID=221103 RepID=V2WUT6_MONRO|nr:hypothetical protein Moror_10226 [Moniliophthora roreri MCA 2997]
METPTSAIPPHPRLRVSRQNLNSFHESSTIAGPSRLPNTPHVYDVDDDRENEEDTPKLPISSTLPKSADPNADYPEDTPAARLRALLSLVPNTNDTVKAARTARLPPQELSTATTIDFIGSDSDIPQYGSTQPSIARESLRDLFSHALREPGDTPRKDVKGKAKRRNSIDASEVEASPRVEKVWKDRSDNKGKRRSLSDDELDPAIKFSQTTHSIKMSHGSTFQLMRERLSSASALQDQFLSDVPLSSVDESMDTTTFLRDLNSSRATLPAATSTPQHSLKMSVNSQFQSNLLDQDSEMRQAMDALDSYEGDSQSILEEGKLPSHSSSSLITRKSVSKLPVSKLPVPQHSNSASSLHDHSTRTELKSRFAFPSSSIRASPVIQTASRTPFPDKFDDSHEHEDSRSRAHTHSGTPDLKHRHSMNASSFRGSSPSIHFPRSSGSGSLHRRASSASIRSVDEDSSRASPAGSQAEYRELLKQREHERNLEREHEWNKPRPRVSSNASIGSVERARTPSISSRPSSRLSISSPTLHRSHHSFSSVSSRASSRAGSPALSHASIDIEAEREREIKVVLDHERERNWNSPRPHWHSHNSHTRSRQNSDASIASVPSLPSSPSSPSASSNLQRPTASSRIRAESLRSERTQSPGLLGVSLPSLRPASPSPAAKASPSLRSSNTSLGLSSLPTRPASPTPLTRKVPPKPHNASPHQFPRSRATPPEALPEASPTAKRHSRTLSSSLTTKSISNPRLSIPGKNQKGSSIPVRSPPTKSSIKASDAVSPSTSTSNVGPVERSSASLMEVPSVVIEPTQKDQSKNGEYSDMDLTDTDGESQLPQESTPTVRTSAALPSDSSISFDKRSSAELSPQPEEALTPQVASPPPGPFRDEARLKKVLSSSDDSPDTSVNFHSVVTSPPSPPPSPPSDTPSTPDERHQETAFALTTPPRSSSFSASAIQFQTPTPPKGLPELPEPPSTPSEDESDTGEDMLTPMTPAPNNLNKSSLKTPKPPGGWSYTPAPQRQNGLLRSSSLPALEDETTSYDSGLATPVASLSRAASVPPQTPALPGGWLATPYPKSVRFETEQSLDSDASALVSTTSADERSEQKDKGFLSATERQKTLEQSEKLQIEASRTAVVADVAEAPAIHTPPPSTPVSPTSKRSRSKSPKRKSFVTVLDEYGRPLPNEDSKPRNRTDSSQRSIRIVDAMGNAIDESTTSDEPSTDEFAHFTRIEALTRVRDGLRDLAQGIDEEKRHARREGSVQNRIKELREASQSAREKREQIQNQAMTPEEMRSKFIEPLRASMRRTRVMTPTKVPQGTSWFRNSWFYWSFGLLQILLLLMMYRASLAYAKHYFLTTYYDPFYPDLHTYTSIPDTINYTSRSLSVSETFRAEGIGASALKIVDNVLIALSEWRRWSWQTLGTDDARLATAWPPT